MIIVEIVYFKIYNIWLFFRIFFQKNSLILRHFCLCLPSLKVCSWRHFTLEVGVCYGDYLGSPYAPEVHHGNSSTINTFFIVLEGIFRSPGALDIHVTKA